VIDTGRSWYLLDLMVIGCVGVVLGLLLAAVAARDRIPDHPPIDPPTKE